METKDFTVSLVAKLKKTPTPLSYTEETEPKESFELLPVAELPRRWETSLSPVLPS